jgi:hypothetical protein
MVHNLGPMNRSFGQIADVAAQELYSIREVSAVSRREVVDHADAVSAGEQIRDQVGTNEPRSTGDDVEIGGRRSRLHDHMR